MNGARKSEGGGPPRVAILFTQFAPYHLDRIEAAARRLAGRAEVVAIECASASETYDWEPPRGIADAERITLFPGRVYEELGRIERYAAYRAATRGIELVLTGVPYSEPDIIALAWTRRREGMRTIAMTCSKADDTPRVSWRERAKALLLGGFSGAIVAATRSRDYLCGLGFANRPILPGYNTMSMARIQAQAAGIEPIAWEERPFVFVGRLVEKKNLAVLLDAYARYVVRAERARRLVLVGKGPLEIPLRQIAAELGIAGFIDFVGHHDSAGVARRLAGSLALVLPSREEQWGLVVNEAVALGIPSLVSDRVGSGDALVRDGRSGVVVEHLDVGCMAAAMHEFAEDEVQWRVMAAGAAERAWLADSERFADAVELLLDCSSAKASANVARFWAACDAR